MVSPAFDSDAWSHFLTSELGRPVAVRFGRSRRQVIVARRTAGRLDVRMHAVFAEAPEEVRSAVARWLSAGRRARRACAELDAWIERITPQLAPGRRERLRPAGEAHDLVELRDEVLAVDFAGERFERGVPPITWGRRGPRAARRSLQLGSFDGEAWLLRIHPVLDQPGVPRWFVRYVVFHELLHAVLPEEHGPSGRKLHHGPGFRSRERAYDDFERALRWQEEHLPRLLASARTGKRLSAPRPGAALLQRWFPSFGDA